MNTLQVIEAVERLAREHQLDPLTYGPAASVAEVDAVEAELQALLPPDVRDFLVRHGRVSGWDIASTTSLQRLVKESDSLTTSLLASKRLREPALLEPLRAGQAKAVVIGTTDGPSVGYSLVLAWRGQRRPGPYWFFWRADDQLERVADDFAAWLDAHLGYALRLAVELAAR